MSQGNTFSLDFFNLNGITKAFVNELVEYNLQINAIAPGYINTTNTAYVNGHVLAVDDGWLVR